MVYVVRLMHSIGQSYSQNSLIAKSVSQLQVMLGYPDGLSLKMVVLEEAV